MTQNRFAYGQNNPTNLVDPTGHRAMEIRDEVPGFAVKPVERTVSRADLPEIRAVNETMHDRWEGLAKAAGGGGILKQASKLKRPDWVSALMWFAAKNASAHAKKHENLDDIWVSAEALCNAAGDQCSNVVISGVQLGYRDWFFEGVSVSVTDAEGNVVSQAFVRGDFFITNMDAVLGH